MEATKEWLHNESVGLHPVYKATGLLPVGLPGQLDTIQTKVEGEIKFILGCSYRRTKASLI